MEPVQVPKKGIGKYANSECVRCAKELEAVDVGLVDEDTSWPVVGAQDARCGTGMHTEMTSPVFAEVGCGPELQPVEVEVWDRIESSLKA